MVDMNRKPLIIPIMGKAKHGKDSLAEYLKQQFENKGKEVLVVRYADYLKYILKKYFDWNGKKDENGRQLLQSIGTNLCRNNNPDVWVNVVIEFIKSLGNKYYAILIPDARFENEINRWYEEGFKVITIRVKRLNEDGSLYDNGLTEEQKKHSSETALDDYIANYEVEATNLVELLDSSEVIVKSILSNIREM